MKKISGTHEPVSLREKEIKFILIQELDELNHLFGWGKRQHDMAFKNININLIYISEKKFNKSDIPFLLK